MKDREFVLHIAQCSGHKVNEDTKRQTITFKRNYSSDAGVVMSVQFKGKESTGVMFDIKEVYNTYGKSKYKNSESFIDALIGVSDGWEKYDSGNGEFYIYTDFSDLKIDHCTSYALASFSILCMALNDLLGRTEKTVSESGWRKKYEDMLDDKIKTCKKVFNISLVVLVIAVAYDLFVFFNGAKNFLAFLFIVTAILTVLAPLVAVFMHIRKKNYLKELADSRSISKK